MYLYYRIHSLLFCTLEFHFGLLQFYNLHKTRFTFCIVLAYALVLFIILLANMASTRFEGAFAILEVVQEIALPGDWSLHVKERYFLAPLVE